MSTAKAILAIDQGTTSSRAILFSLGGEILFSAQNEFTQFYPDNGWVEHDPEEIWNTTLGVVKEALAKAESMGLDVLGAGITNQRETTVIWEKDTGKPIYKAIVWQDRRTAEICRRLHEDHLDDEVSERAGLVIDPYFSATKAAWILDHVEGARARAEKGELCFGTIDTFLIWRLTGGKAHVTDATNACRTSLFNIRTQDWDDELLRIFNVPKAILPSVQDCAGLFGEADEQVLGRKLAILGVAGDQQAAAIGQACFQPGSIKSTYGTGCFVILNTGDTPLKSGNRLLTTVGYRLNGEVTYALEGAIFIAGAVIQWLRDGLGIIGRASQTEAMAKGQANNHGVYMVPAFTGLGAPYWDPDVRASIFGLTRDSGPDAFVRAALESVAYQTRDLFRAMAEDGVKPYVLRVDGGMVANDWLMHFLSDILAIPVERPKVVETTAWGAAALAALADGAFSSLDDVAKDWALEKRFEPTMGLRERSSLLAGWDEAVTRTRLKLH